MSEVTVSGSLAKRFQAVQQASGIASQLSGTLMAGQGNRLKVIGDPCEAWSEGAVAPLAAAFRLGGASAGGIGAGQRKRRPLRDMIRFV